MNELSLFTGAGGGLLGTKLLGWTAIGYVEKEPYCQKVLRQRIADGILDAAPIFGDIRKFISEGYAASYTGMVDVITGGFPCQPFSVAGKRKQAEDERNMWPATADVIGIVKPRFVLLENVPGVREYLPVVVRDLRRCGYEVRHPLQLGADDVGAPHRRKRVWILAISQGERLEGVKSRAGERLRGRLELRSGAYAADTPQRKDDRRERGNMDEAAEGRESFNTALDACGEDVAYAEREQTDEKRKTCERGRDSMGWHKQAALCENRQAGTDCIIGQGDHVADSNGMRELQPQRSFCDEQRRVSDGSEETADTDRTGRKEQRCPVTIGTEHEAFKCRGWWAAEPAVGRMAYGVASRVDRLRCLSNGQVPIVAASAWRILMDT